jgi:hypothetical protein
MGTLDHRRLRSRAVLRHRFGSIDAFYCCLAIVPSGFFLLVFSYVLTTRKTGIAYSSFHGRNSDFLVSRDRRHARIDDDGGVAVPALGEWKNKKGQPQSTEAHGGWNAKGR